MAIDDSGNARDGTLSGFVGDDSQWVAGRIDGAIRVNSDGAVGNDVESTWSALLARSSGGAR